MVGCMEGKIGFLKKRVAEHGKLFLNVAYHIAHIGAVVHLVAQHLCRKGETILAAIFLIDHSNVGATHLVLVVDRPENKRIFCRHMLALLLADGQAQQLDVGCIGFYMQRIVGILKKEGIPTYSFRFRHPIRIFINKRSPFPKLNIFR